MALEIERKFLLRTGAWHPGPGDHGTPIQQGYLCRDVDRTVRIRIAGSHATLTIKSRPTGLVRQEFEYPIPLDDARQLLQLCPLPPVEKRRYHCPIDGLLWEIDIYQGANNGLVVAEVELASATQPVTLPPWIEREISGDPRYANSQLASQPYSTWTD